MLKITRGATNVFIFTLNEKKTLTNPHYLCVFKSESSREKVRKVLPADESSQTKRYNQFTMTEGIDITLKPAGQWEYAIYEQLSPTNTDETLSDNKTPIERGLAYVIGADNIYVPYSSSVPPKITYYGTGST